jgi:long-chain fatty acid transport protein
MKVNREIKMNKSSDCLIRPKPTGKLFASLVGAASLLPLFCHAVGFRLPNQDPEGIARGNAFVATADNPSAIYYNPAGITQLQGSQFHAGLYMISANTKYTSFGGATARTDTEVQFVPQLYFTHSLSNTPFTLGLGLYAPYGLSLDWGNSSPFSPITQNGKLLYATMNPIFAWRVHSTLSLAAGPTINYADADLENASFKFNGDDIGVGFKAGILWQPYQQWSFGASYHSATDLELSGDSQVPAFSLGNSATKAKAHFPQFIVAGISYRPTTNWNFEINLDWTDWDSVDQLLFRRDDTVTVPFLFNYTSSFMYEFGITRQLGRGWSVSVGYIFSENSSPDADFNPIIPDSDLHLGSIGVAHRGLRWNWAVGYHFAYGERDVTGGAGASVLANGNYKTFNQAVNVSGTMKF